MANFFSDNESKTRTTKRKRKPTEKLVELHNQISFKQKKIKSNLSNKKLNQTIASLHTNRLEVKTIECEKCRCGAYAGPSQSNQYTMVQGKSEKKGVKKLVKTEKKEKDVDKLATKFKDFNCKKSKEIKKKKISATFQLKSKSNKIKRPLLTSDKKEDAKQKIKATKNESNGIKNQERAKKKSEKAKKETTLLVVTARHKLTQKQKRDSKKPSDPNQKRKEIFKLPTKLTGIKKRTFVTKTLSGGANIEAKVMTNPIVLTSEGPDSIKIENPNNFPTSKLSRNPVDSKNTNIKIESTLEKCKLCTFSAKGKRLGLCVKCKEKRRRKKYTNVKDLKISKAMDVNKVKKDVEKDKLLETCSITNKHTEIKSIRTTNINLSPSKFIPNAGVESPKIKEINKTKLAWIDESVVSENIQVLDQQKEKSENKLIQQVPFTSYDERVNVPNSEVEEIKNFFTEISVSEILNFPNIEVIEETEKAPVETDFVAVNDM